tara:strand:- start:747 stop:914 length:168 start_codon:yes stop_codon:yes gene_type:complete
MFWDLVIGLMLCFSYIMHYATAKKVDALQKDVDDLMSMMRVLRYRAMQDNKGGDD